MEKNEKLNDLFKENKKDFPDNGFSRSVTDTLPPRNSLIPVIVIFVSFAVSVVLFAFMGGFGLLSEQIDMFAEAVNVSQMPPLSSIATIAALFATSGLLGYSAMPCIYDNE